MKPDERLFFWETGRSIHGVLRSFAFNKAERAALVSIDEGLVWSVLSELSETHAYAKENNVNFSAALAAIQLIQKQTTELHDSVVSRLMLEVRRGEIAFLGFEPPRRMSDVPVEIRIPYLGGKIEWANGTVRSNGLHFVDVRIARLSSNAPKPLGRLEVGKVGRRSRQEVFFACFTALQLEGKMSPEKSQKSHFFEVRKWLSRNYPEIFPTEESGSDKTIYRYFKRFQDGRHESG